MSKMITINTAGPIFPKGGIIGPIATPYKEDFGTIAVLLMNNYEVEEVLEDDVRVKLDLKNYRADNGMKKEEALSEVALSKGEVSPDFNPGTDVQLGETQLEEAPTPQVEKKEEVSQPQQQHQNHKKNKNKQRQLQADDLQAK